MFCQCSVSKIRSTLLLSIFLMSGISKALLCTDIENRSSQKGSTIDLTVGPVDLSKKVPGRYYSGDSQIEIVRTNAQRFLEEWPDSDRRNIPTGRNLRAFWRNQKSFSINVTLRDSQIPPSLLEVWSRIKEAKARKIELNSVILNARAKIPMHETLTYGDENPVSTKVNLADMAKRSGLILARDMMGSMSHPTTEVQKTLDDTYDSVDVVLQGSLHSWALYLYLNYQNSYNALERSPQNRGDLEDKHGEDLTIVEVSRTSFPPARSQRTSSTKPTHYSSGPM